MEGEYKPEEIEPKWRKKWVDQKTYHYTETEDREETFTIDTPPPTVSGSLHFGHTYGNTLTDFMARFQRMQGKKVFFPFGYDNNGIASERLTERELDIKHQNYTRREFQEKVRKVCQEYEKEFREVMQKFAFSMDWDNTYKTIEPRIQKISQLSFIDLYKKDREYRKKAPAIWCPDCETAISQVEMEDAERDSHFNDIEFELPAGGSIIISTTRPELLPACVGIIVHPEDESHNHLAGETAKVPIFGHEVPIIEDERVDPETGTGVVMTCTFGDQTDIEWYQAYDLDLRVAIDKSGRMTQVAEDYEGMTTEEARQKIAEDLKEEGHLVDRRPITHDVQVHERCGTDTEFLVTEQWYIKLLDKKQEYLEAGKQLDWQPEKMYTRYRHWIEGLQWDWCISRQRDSGIPFPVWYCTECNKEIIAERDQLPVDPIQDSPPVEECPECGNREIEPEEDVLDTWATSSLTPLINAGWSWNKEKQEFYLKRPELYPMNLRPQGHDIISFWLFHTIVKCIEHTGEIPFDEVMINGMILDENREKMSKSKGNIISPLEVLEEFPVDAARYWSAGSKVGEDLPFKKKDLVAGEKLIRKLWNASKLVTHLAPEKTQVKQEQLEEIDKWMLAKLDETIEYVTEKMENYEFSKARDRLRHVFWETFCDNYLEITKQRLEGEENPSAEHTLQKVHKKFIQMFAPIMPHVTEEIWHQTWGEESIHKTQWPKKEEIEADLEKGETAMEVISALRKYKSSKQQPLNKELEKVKVHGNIEGFKEAIKEVMHVQNLETLEKEPEVEKKISEIKLDYEKAGPKYGDKINKIEQALEQNEWTLDAGHLEVAGEHLKPEFFKVKESREFKGEGEMIETENSAVIILD